MANGGTLFLTMDALPLTAQSKLRFLQERTAAAWQRTIPARRRQRGGGYEQRPRGADPRPPVSVRSLLSVERIVAQPDAVADAA
jgi:hypothetical protein